MNKSIKLAEIRTIRAGIFAAYPDLADDEQALADTMEGETDYVELVAAAVESEAEAKAAAEAVAGRIAEMKARKERWERKADAEREFARRVMEAVGVRKLTLPEATIFMKASPRSLIVTDEDAAISAGFSKTKVELDKSSLKSALQGGASFPFAVMSNGGVSLTITRK